MANRQLIMTLAKVLIAAAWIDGEMTLEETNSLKDLLFQLPRTDSKGNQHLTAEEWAMLDMYIETPVSEREREQLVEQLGALLHTADERMLIEQALQNLVQADDVITPKEQEMVDQIGEALANVNVSILGQLGRMMGGAVARRNSAMQNAPNRERYFEDYLRNKVFYGIRRRLDAEADDIDIPEPNLRWLAAIGGLLARVAQVDRTVTDDEFDAIAALLHAVGTISAQEANFVAEVAVSEIGAEMDLLRLTRELYSSMTPEEGEQILDLLFAVADADGQVSNAEGDIIYSMARNLGLTHRQFIAAKLKIPRERRES